MREVAGWASSAMATRQPAQVKIDLLTASERDLTGEGRQAGRAESPHLPRAEEGVDRVPEAVGAVHPRRPPLVAVADDVEVTGTNGRASTGHELRRGGPQLRLLLRRELGGRGGLA